ncbi:HNH endonuclease [Serratia fonticola]|uniref:HNH endonuclease n=1 Tax=Serratia fonticola TaxID=47917 RepID=UPI001AEA5BC8|nr:HNH endonuclease signature motif containing protein [Serratia fonticola]MBP1039029.1 HNH endonuclease [Serratia fonticola]
MTTFIELQYRKAISIADFIQGQIFNAECYIPFEHSFYMGENVLKIAIKPSKFTLLHDYITYNLLESYRHSLKKVGSEIYNDIYDEFDMFGVGYVKYESYRDRDYHNYLYVLFESKVSQKLVESTFTILFNDRATMQKFNEQISFEIRKLSVNEWPLYLVRDGVMKRNTYWPKWLYAALFRREQGHCAICQKNLTGLMANGADPAIDHIIPLNLGGTNDPTNLQMLCAGCNTDKSGDSITTSNMHSPFW